jgi:hypothetical protein
MSLFKIITQIASIVISLLEFVLYPGTGPVIANLKDLSANAKTYEEWLLYQEELDALSQQSIWSVKRPFCSS